MDNLETVKPEQECKDLVCELFQILGRSRLLVTSRHKVRHSSVYTIGLGGLRENSSVAFLRQEGKARHIPFVARARREELARIHRVTGGAPLALKLVAGQAGSLPLEEVLSILERARFKERDYEFYRFVFRHSWDMLDHNAQDVLLSMSVFAAGIGVEVEDIEMASEVEGSSAFYGALDRLVQMSLVDPLGGIDNRCYAIHQLTGYFLLSDILERWK
jgi:hypothetical protein